MCVVCSAYIVRKVRQWLAHRASVIALHLEPAPDPPADPKPDDDTDEIDAEIRALEFRVRHLRGVP